MTIRATVRRQALPLALVLAFSPFAALAAPALGDMVGTNPDDAKAALAETGCIVDDLKAEDGKIEAKCNDDATGAMMEIHIDPASGAVVEINAED